MVNTRGEADAVAEKPVVVVAVSSTELMTSHAPRVIW